MPSASGVVLADTHIKGEVRPLGANIGIQLICSGGAVLINPGGHALMADSCQLWGSLVFALGETSVGSVNLAYVQIGTLADNLANRPDTYNLVGFTYNLLSGDQDLKRRLTGSGFVVGLGNGLILGYLMYSSALVPRGMAVLGLIGGPLI